jgi:O-antigen/teichoic acid export membrane protein
MLWQFSLPLLLDSALHAPVFWICQALIVRHPGGTTELGLYDAGQKWMTVVMVAPFAASAAFSPILANLSGEGDASVFRRTTGGLALVQFALTAIPAALVALAAPWAVLVFGPSFASAAQTIPIMMLLAPVYVLKHLYWQVLTGRGRAWTALFVGALWAAVAIGLTWEWQESGAAGLAKAMVCAYGVALVVSMSLVEW